MPLFFTPFPSDMLLPAMRCVTLRQKMQRRSSMAWHRHTRKSARDAKIEGRYNSPLRRRPKSRGPRKQNDEKGYAIPSEDDSLLPTGPRITTGTWQQFAVYRLPFTVCRLPSSSVVGQSLVATSVRIAGAGSGLDRKRFVLHETGTWRAAGCLRYGECSGPFSGGYSSLVQRGGHCVIHFTVMRCSC